MHFHFSMIAARALWRVTGLCNCDHKIGCATSADFLGKTRTALATTDRRLTSCVLELEPAWQTNRAVCSAPRRGRRVKASCGAHCDEEDAGPERSRWLRHQGTEQRDACFEPAGRCTTTARKAVRTAKVGACACTNTWTREAYNLGALGVVFTTKTALSRRVRRGAHPLRFMRFKRT